MLIQYQVLVLSVPGKSKLVVCFPLLIMENQPTQQADENSHPSCPTCLTDWIYPTEN